MLLNSTLSLKIESKIYLSKDWAIFSFHYKYFKSTFSIIVTNKHYQPIRGLV